MPGTANLRVHASVSNPKNWLIQNAIRKTILIGGLYRLLHAMRQTTKMSLLATLIGMVCLMLWTQAISLLGESQVRQHYGSRVGWSFSTLINNTAALTLLLCAAKRYNFAPIALLGVAALIAAIVPAWQYKVTQKVSLEVLAVTLLLEGVALLAVVAFPFG